MKKLYPLLSVLFLIYLGCEEGPINYDSLIRKNGVFYFENDDKPYSGSYIFFATWCVPCAKEIPELTKMSNEFDDDFQFLLVDVNEKRDKVKEHVRKKNISLQVVLDKYGKTFEKFGGKTLPLLVVINKKGKITYHHTGYKKGDEIKLKEHLNTL